MITIRQAMDKMATVENFDWDPEDAWSVDEVAKLEESLLYSRDPGDSTRRMLIPVQLREFLLEVGICSAGYDDAFLVKFDGGGTAINETQVIGSATPDRIIKNSTNFLSYHYGEKRDKLMPGRVPNGYIFMGTAEGGHAHLLMDGTNPDNNAVYIWGLAYDPWGEGDNTLGIGKCGDTLAEFLYNLQPRENL